MKGLRDENGVALILALIMLLIMSALAVAISFISNTDFQMMSNFKQGQEAFLAAERCIAEGRKQLEIGPGGIAGPYSQIQGGASIGILSDTDGFPAIPGGAKCRTGPRGYSAADGPPPFISLPPVTKDFGRPIRNSSIDRARAVPTAFIVTGKDAGDRDLDDIDPEINTGTEIAVGFESFIPGGALNAY